MRSWTRVHREGLEVFTSHVAEEVGGFGYSVVYGPRGSKRATGSVSADLDTAKAAADRIVRQMKEAADRTAGRPAKPHECRACEWWREGKA
jgi:hypothetical protein